MNEQDQVRKRLEAELASTIDYAKDASVSIIVGDLHQQATRGILKVMEAVEQTLSGELPPLQSCSLTTLRKS